MILLGDCRSILPTLDAGSVRCCVTSPPYWGLRDYGVEGQLGLEPTPEEYVSQLVAVFREVRRVLADDGTLWLNLGDSYFSNQSDQVADSLRGIGSKHDFLGGTAVRPALPAGARPKNLVGIPWRVAFALQADGWYLRSDIIWHKPNPMPESVTDRPTKSHEYVFLLSKRERYFYDAGAIAEKALIGLVAPNATPDKVARMTPDVGTNGTGLSTLRGCDGTRNARTVWTIPTQPTPDAHFATFPEALAERCILAGSAEGDTVLDPFFGSGTVGEVAERLGRRWIGIELNEGYVRIAEDRTAQQGLFLPPGERRVTKP